MTKYLPLLLLSALFASPFLTTASAGGTGYRTYRSTACAESKFQTPRYNQSLPYRHYEDHRRYNAAACSNEVIPTEPYLIKTVIVRKKRVPYYTYDSKGRRCCSKVLHTIYKDIYSNGGCRVWTKVG